ncbi:MAG: Hint domain-containing protein [Marinovum sp.]|nr:Hint domain-containing protein [Marinovum sp.]
MAERLPTQGPAHIMHALRAAALAVVDGANLGDVMGCADEVQCDDIYHYESTVPRGRLTLAPKSNGAFVIVDGSEMGTPGHHLHLDCCVTFMDSDGATIDCIVAVEVDGDGMIEEIYPIPLGVLEPHRDYRVIGVDRAEARRKFAQIGCVSFTRGTRITMADGAQKPIQELRAGDRVLTRDAGPQEVRWVGSNTVKAEGAFAPILIKAGTLNNLGDLLVSPDHRLFVYQRQDTLGAGRSEVLVRAQHLVNGQSVLRVEGGYVDYLQLLFDEHQIIYAEGIAAESLLVDGQTRPALPEDLAEKFAKTLPGRDTGLRADYEVSETLARRPDAVDLLRRASSR